MRLGDSMDELDLLLGFGLIVVFLHNIFLHRSLKILHYALKGVRDDMGELQTGVNTLDTKSKNLKEWSVKVHQWLTHIGGKNDE